ncbi:hypothetical protein CRG98_008907 [Punica granatum]|uniref:Uncharacterized protein n=1 Tax=Punica granatum TaxID=22663 RepID=A0A2I0KQ98_PUNGR|nr:hypothetical protein CRG98_008907 [Punica granatum]
MVVVMVEVMGVRLRRGVKEMLGVVEKVGHSGGRLSLPTMKSSIVILIQLHHFLYVESPHTRSATFFNKLRLDDVTAKYM